LPTATILHSISTNCIYNAILQVFDGRVNDYNKLTTLELRKTSMHLAQFYPILAFIVYDIVI